jgi:hypothetical protein
VFFPLINKLKIHARKCQVDVMDIKNETIVIMISGVSKDNMILSPEK